MSKKEEIFLDIKLFYKLKLYINTLYIQYTYSYYQIIANSIMKKIERQLNEWFKQYHKSEFLTIDPLVSVRKIKSNPDREVGALIASVISYGRVEIIIKNCEQLFSLMNWKPAEFVTSTSIKKNEKMFSEFRHRFTSSEDIVLLMEVLGKIIRTSGSIEQFFIEGYDHREMSFKDAIVSFCKRVKKIARENVLYSGRGFEYLFPSPESGSACKRINMFLRWVVRDEDTIDLGLWKMIKPSQLIMPVDTHIAEQSKKLKLTKRNAADWKMAEEITNVFRKIDPDDPVRFDFSLCRAGMMGKRNEG